MRVICLFMVLFPVALRAEDVARARKVAITRGLDFLVRDAQAWKAEHQCVSCHHAGLVRWALQESRQRGIAVDEPVLDFLTAWIADSGPGTTSVPRPPEAPRALNTKALWFALALGPDASPAERARDGFAGFIRTLTADQMEDGRWVAWPNTRAPMFGNSEASVTALAALALIPSASREDATARPALGRALTWLKSSAPDAELQSLTMRLVVWQRTEQPAAEIGQLTQRLRRAQRHDGGWSQVPGLPSDAWATGQALYALADQAGGEQSLLRGQQYLLANQRPDGSWPMESRPTSPGGEPAGLLVPITGAGSAWAVLGLVRCLPDRD